MEWNVLDFLIHVSWVSFYVGLLVEVLNFPVWPNQYPNASGVGGISTLASTISQAHGPLGVAKQRKIEGKLLGEVFIFLLGIKADAQNLCVFFLKFFVDVAEPATLDRSPRGVGFGIKPQNNVFTGKITEAYGVAVVVLNAEIRRVIAGLKHGSPPLVKTQLWIRWRG